jgi:hypothetical protein
MNDRIKFLKSLDTKLHEIVKCHGSGNWVKKEFFVDNYKEDKMNVKEIERVLEISKSANFVIYPINTSFGFSVGYDLCKICLTGKEVLLRFKESQLPEGYNFERLSKVFISKKNIIKAKLIGEEIFKDYSHYDY